MAILNNYNEIDPSTQIPSFCQLGSYNVIGRNVQFIAAANSKYPKLKIGDCNVISDNTKIIVGDNEVNIGDWNVIHNNVLLIGQGVIRIKNNCWVGQYSVLDGSGNLFIENGVRIGMFSQVWTHVSSGELLEGCTLNSFNPTIINDNVWLVGSCIVGSGVILGENSICLGGSYITTDTIAYKVYSGNPAVIKPNLKFYRKISLNEKFDMLYNWLVEYGNGEENLVLTRENGALIVLKDIISNERLIFGNSDYKNPEITEKDTFFDLSKKVFYKRNSILERKVYRYLFNFKARFKPLSHEYKSS